MSIEQAPRYLAGAESDPLMILMAVLLLVIVLLLGVLYFKLHSVPESIAHGKNHTQLQLIAILTILALFTHNNIFWIAALVLAVVEFPDFLGPVKSIAKSLETIAGKKTAEKPQKSEEVVTSTKASTSTEAATESDSSVSKESSVKESY